MIKTTQQLNGAHEALGHLYLALASLRRTVLNGNPIEFGSLAEGTIQEIFLLRKEIGNYLGLENADVNYSGENPSASFAIEGDQQLTGTHEALGDLYRAVDSLRVADAQWKKIHEQ